MAGSLFNKPVNRVVQNDFGGPLFAEISPNATYAQMIPGIIVASDTAVSDMAIIPASDPSNNIAVLGYEETLPADQPASITSAYTQNAQNNQPRRVAIHNTPGMRFRGWIAANQPVKPGTRLKCTTAGQLTPITASTDPVNAIAQESATGTTAFQAWCLWIMA